MCLISLVPLILWLQGFVKYISGCRYCDNIPIYNCLNQDCSAVSSPSFDEACLFHVGEWLFGLKAFLSTNKKFRDFISHISLAIWNVMIHFTAFDPDCEKLIIFFTGELSGLGLTSPDWQEGLTFLGRVYQEEIIPSEFSSRGIFHGCVTLDGNIFIFGLESLLVISRTRDTILCFWKFVWIC